MSLKTFVQVYAAFISKITFENEINLQSKTILYTASNNVNHIKSIDIAKTSNCRGQSI